MKINFSRGVHGGSLSLGKFRRLGGYQFLTNIENPGKLGGGGVLSEILSMVGYEYFLELHNLHKNMMHVQSCCFANTNPLLFCLSCSLMLTSKHTFGDWS